MILLYAKLGWRLLSEQVWHSKLRYQRFSFHIFQKLVLDKPVCPFTFTFWISIQIFWTHLHLIFSQLFATKQSIVLLFTKGSLLFQARLSWHSAVFDQKTHPFKIWSGNLSSQTTRQLNQIKWSNCLIWQFQLNVPAATVVIEIQALFAVVNHVKMCSTWISWFQVLDFRILESRFQLSFDMKALHSKQNVFLS